MTRGECPQLSIKNIYKTLQITSYLTVKNKKLFHCVQEQGTHSCHSLFFLIILEVLVNAIRQEEEIKGRLSRKEKVNCLCSQVT